MLPMSSRKMHFLSFRGANLEKILIGFSVLSLILFFIALYTVLFSNRNSIIDSSRDALDRIAVAAETGASRITLSIDATLLASADALDHLPDGMKNDQKQAIDLLKAFAEQNFYIKEIIILDNNGNQVLSSFGAIDITKRQNMNYILNEHLLNGVNDSILVTVPPKNDLKKEKVIDISRAINFGKGVFSGFIVAEVDTSSFNDLFSKLISGSGINMFLFDQDGTLLVREPSVIKMLDLNEYSKIIEFMKNNNLQEYRNYIDKNINFFGKNDKIQSVKKIKLRNLYILSEKNIDIILKSWNDFSLIAFYIYLVSVLIVLVFNVSIVFLIKKQKKDQLIIVDALHHLNEGFVLFDKAGRFLMCNERYKEVYAGAASMIRPGVLQADILRVSALAGDFGEIPQDLDRWLREQAETKPNYVGILERKLANGRWIQVSQQRMSDGGYVGILTEITGLKQQQINLGLKEDELHHTITELERSKRQLEHQADDLSRLARDLVNARDRAEEASRAKSQFLANMSHELRTPLNAVIGFAELLELEFCGTLNSKQRDYIKDIRESGMHLLEIINDVLDLSKIEAGREELREQITDLGALIESQMTIVRPRATELGLHLAVKIREGVDGVLLDPLKTRQMVLNLLSNAVKFTPQGGLIEATAQIEPMDAEEFPGWIRITIQDTGIGIKTEDLGIVREPFRQVENHLVRRFDGTGLGLAITEAQVRLHGGRMDIESAPGQGTKVTLWLPPWRSKAERPKTATHDILVYS